MENLAQLDKLEKQMAVELSSEEGLLDNLQRTKKLADLKKQIDGTKERSVFIMALHFCKDTILKQHQSEYCNGVW